MHEGFVHLHVRSHFSIGRGLIRIPDLCHRVARLGMPAVALTDFCNTAGLDEFRREAVAAGIAPIYGMEIPVTYSELQGEVNTPERIVVLVENAAGWRNLLALAGMLCIDPGLEARGVPWSVFASHAAGLILLLDCRDGSIGRWLWNGERQRAAAALGSWRDTAGRDAVFLELAGWRLPHDTEFFSALVSLARQAGVRAVASGDVRFLTQRDFGLWRFISGTAEIPEGSGSAWLQGGERMRRLFRQYQDAFAETGVIAGRCSGWIAEGHGADCMSDRWRSVAELACPDLSDACHAGLEKRVGTNLAVYREALERELRAAAGSGMHAFYRMAAALARFLQENRFAAAGCVGEGGASLVLYALGLMVQDPVACGVHEKMFDGVRIRIPRGIVLMLDPHSVEQVVAWLRRDSPVHPLRIVSEPVAAGAGHDRFFQHLLYHAGFPGLQADEIGVLRTDGHGGDLAGVYWGLYERGFSTRDLVWLRRLLRGTRGFHCGWDDEGRSRLSYLLCDAPPAALLPCGTSGPDGGVRIGAARSVYHEAGMVLFDLVVSPAGE